MKVVIIFCCLFSFAFNSCGDDDSNHVDCTSEIAFQAAIQDEQNAFDDALTIFGDDRSI